MAKKQSTAKQSRTATPAAAASASAIAHLEGCPAERIESYDATRPGDAKRQPVELAVARCIDCGAATVETKET